jgi:hypothetical protein
MKDSTPNRCPICGEGILVTLRFDLRTAPGSRPLRQGAESREAVTYDCGHTLAGPRLATADADALDVERRTSDETVGPRPGDGG